MTQTRSTPQSSPRNRNIIIAVVVGLLVAGAAIYLGPQRIALATERPTGDEAVSDSLAENAPAGARNLSAFTIADGEVRFGGLGSGEHTEFEIGSITKTFTAELLRNAVDRGDMSLDTTVGEIIDAGDAPIADVAMEELANHTSGLPRLAGFSLSDIGYLLWGGNPYADTTVDDIFAAALDADLSDRGEEEYSNFGFALLGHLIATNQDTSYEQLLIDDIFTPLGMDETYLMTPGSVADDAPRGVRADGRDAAPWEMEGDAPAGAIRSTAADMSRYALHLLGAGVPDYTWVTDSPDHATWHNGGTGGYQSMLALDLENQTAAYVINDSTTRVDDLGLTLLEGANA